MMRILFSFLCISSFYLLKAQDMQKALSVAIGNLEKDPQFNHAILSMYVVESNTGKVAYEKNAEAGLAPASCQKVITSASAFELLGNNYQYKTPVKVSQRQGYNRLFIEGSGDPTIGSWRWAATNMDVVYKNILDALIKNKVTTLNCNVSVNEKKFTYQPIPDGWVWQDIGNYFGAGARAFNWHEDQYDLLLRSGVSVGDSTGITGFDPPSAAMPFLNLITTGKAGSGDNSYIYCAPNSNTAFATGTIPPAQSKFVISGSMPNPIYVFNVG